MDRIWQWAWDRHGPRYSWAAYVVTVLFSVPAYLFWSFLIVAIEESGNYVEAAAVTVVAVPLLGYANMLPGVGRGRLIDQWAAGHEISRASALEATYAYARGMVGRTVAFNAVFVGLLSVVVGAIAGVTGARLVEYGIVGALVGTGFGLSAVHSLAEAAIRPARVAIAGDTGIGDSLPRSRPTFATWSNVFVLAALFGFVVYSAMLAAVFDRAREEPILFAAI